MKLRQLGEGPKVLPGYQGARVPSWLANHSHLGPLCTVAVFSSESSEIPQDGWVSGQRGLCSLQSLIDGGDFGAAYLQEDCLMAG